MKYNWNDIDFKSFFSENVTFPLVIKAQMNNEIFKERWFLFFQQRGTQKKSHEELNLRPSESLFHTVEKNQISSFFISLPSSKLTISLISM